MVKKNLIVIKKDKLYKNYPYSVRLKRCDSKRTERLFHAETKQKALSYAIRFKKENDFILARSCKTTKIIS